ncbi:MAG: hypothetical protein AAGA06_12085 [Pseudomonadota bacterium]
MSAVRLMRRNGEDWVEERVEKIDSPDIEQRLEKLVAPIMDDGPVMLFLPRDQILYTRVELNAAEDAQPQIERALDGRTPYGLDELSFDWEEVDPNTVQVAALARDTLDEAAAFAEVRHLKIAGYSTLFSGDDFPRLPKFDGPDLVDDPPATEPPVTFATARVPSRPPDADIAAAAVAASSKARFTPTPTSAEVAGGDAETPVLQVDDATPVVKVKPPQAPLDPGLPISAPNAPPRIRTDIAASSVSGHAASLTPPGGSVRMRKTRAPISTLAVFAVAFLLTVGIAVLVWNYLPMRPSATADAPVDTGALPEAIVEDAAPGPLAEEEAPRVIAENTTEASTEPEVATAVLDATTTAPISDVTTQALAPPSEDEVATLTTSARALPDRPAVSKIAAAPTIAALPDADRTAPELQLPTMTASIQTAPPFLGPDPETDETADSVYISAFEVPEPATDAIALPNPRQFTADPLPNAEGEAVAGLDPAVTEDPVASAVEQALADALAGPAGLIPTDLARSVADTAPRARPEQFTEQIERQQFGGRTRTELSGLRPPARPESAQSLAAVQASPPSELAVASSITPRTRPGQMAALVAAARVQQEAARVTATAAVATAPDTSRAIEAALEEDTEPQNRAVRPRILSIPTTASVARQATVENAIRLNRINLVGVYGAPSDRRALVRLSSGRYVKVKVGDRVDGGTVRQITDSELYYSKGNRTLSLEVPQG